MTTIPRTYNYLYPHPFQPYCRYKFKTEYATLEEDVYNKSSGLDPRAFPRFTLKLDFRGGLYLRFFDYEISTEDLTECDRFSRLLPNVFLLDFNETNKPSLLVVQALGVNFVFNLKDSDRDFIQQTMELYRTH